MVPEPVKIGNITDYASEKGGGKMKLRRPGQFIGVRFPTDARDFPLMCRVQTGTGADTAPYTMSIGSSFPALKQPGHEANH